MAVVAWDPDGFAQRFPEFAPATSGIFADLFTEAGLLCDNSGAGPVKDPAVLKVLLFLLTAHLAKLYVGANGDGGGQQGVGRVSQGSEGTVSVSLDMGQVQNDQAWYVQTPYGAQYWAMSSPFRRFVYVPSCRR